MGILLTFSSMLLSVTSKAHNIVYYNPPCFTAGNSVSLSALVINAGANSFYHWQFRATPGGAWTYVNNGTTTINGRSFATVGGWSKPVTANTPPTLVITNVGTPAYTTQLNGVEFRLLMTDGLDPQTNPGTSIWGGEEYLNPYEAKYVRISAKPATEGCYTACTDNRLVTNPASPTMETYFGGFEMGNGDGTDNFSTPNGTTGATAKATTGLTRWTTTSTAERYRVINNPDSMNSAWSAIAPRSGKQMMVVSNITNSSTIAWSRVITVSNANTFFQGGMTFRGWFSKVYTGGTDPVIVIEVQGATATNSSSYTTISTQTLTISATPGTWSEMVVTPTIPVNTYKKLRFNIRPGTNSTISFAIDDLCMLEPVSGILPVVLKPLKGAYIDGRSHLTWASLQESNSSHFEIQRSDDGQHFSAIGRVNAVGSSDRQVDYQFDDVKANAGVNYYRLKLIDKDANFQYSNIVALTVNIKGTTITGIYPAPFNDKVNVTVSSETNIQANVRLFDNTGKLLVSKQATLTKGINNIVLDNLAALAKGFYIIKVQAGEVMSTQKLIK